MNAIATVNPGLVPANMTEAMKLAEMMASAKLVPQGLQQSPADCLMVIQQAVRWQMDPFAVAQECSVIQGKLMHSGKLVAAVVNARGNLQERLSFAYEGDGENRKITVSGRCQGEADRRAVTVRLGDVKTNNRVWQSQPDQQLMYHGCRVWARRHTPELMLGVWSPEEFDEAANGNSAAPVVIENDAPAKPPKRTREQISAEANRKRQDVRSVTDDILQIDDSNKLEQYVEQELTPEFMASLGMKQYAVEQTLETHRIALHKKEAEAELSEPVADEARTMEEPPPETTEERLEDKAEYIRSCHSIVDEIADEKQLLDWWNSREQKTARRNYLLTKEEVQALMARTMSRRAEILASGEALMEAGG